VAGELLRCVSGQIAGQDLLVGDGLVFGRNAGEPGALGGDGQLSRTHARLSRDASGRLIIEDLGSTNGTWVNRARIAAPTPLGPGDELRLGQTVFRVVAGVAARPPEPEDAGDQAPTARPAPQAPAAPFAGAQPPVSGQPPAASPTAAQPPSQPGDVPRLRVAAGNLAGQEIPVERELHIGRSFPGVGQLGGDNRVSRRHARFALGPSGLLFVQDSGSTNGTFVNGAVIRGPRSLRDGDQVQVGATTLVVQGARASSFPAFAAGGGPVGFVPQGAAPARRRSGVIIAAFAAFLAIAVGVSSAVVSALAPDGPKKCALDQPCQGPPTAEPLANATRYRSESLGYSFQYDDESLQVGDQSDTGVELNGDSISIDFEGSPASEVSPEQAVQAKLDDIGSLFVGLEEDLRPEKQIFQPTVGYHEGVGSAYAGTENSPQGPGTSVRVVVMAASDDQTTVLVTVVTDSPDDESVLGFAGDAIKTLRFPTDGAT
jgi:pSer/pThr/pTyr-binding forkhead associated (FHA) protein